MLRIDVASLRLSELRGLLATARSRGNGALAEQLEAELAARASGLAPLPDPDPEPPFENEDVLPIDLGPPLEDFRFEPWLTKPKRRWPIVGLVATVVVTAGAALAWSLSGLPRREPPPAAGVVPPPAPRAMTVRAEPIAPPAPAPPVEPPPPVAEPDPAPPTRLDPCATPPTPADRLLCRDLALNLLEHEMREAYGRALTSGADPIALRDSQAAWRRARDSIADPRALAAAYDERIRELDAQAEPPPP